MILGDNTDGAGLVRDLKHNLGCDPGGRRILLLGAGGAARGVILPLLLENPAELVIANRTEETAARLALEFARLPGCARRRQTGWHGLPRTCRAAIRPGHQRHVGGTQRRRAATADFRVCAALRRL